MADELVRFRLQPLWLITLVAYREALGEVERLRAALALCTCEHARGYHGDAGCRPPRRPREGEDDGG